ncbi:MAG TPA: hypothetical protein VHO72_10640 [Bacteroidales bacterium]|nr:hypothetical protein [Bacteroidales bacterium]
MTDKQENRLRMYYAVSAVCDTNSELWQENEAFGASYRKFQAKIPLIRKYADILRMEAIASESFKCIDRIELEEMAFYFSSKLLVFAKETKNEALASEMHSGRNAIIKSSDNELIAICNMLVTESSKYIEELKGDSITPESITEFQNFVTFFSGNYNRLRHVVSKNKTAEELLKKYFKEVEEILKDKLDNDIEFFRNSYPEFYQEFKASRNEYSQVINDGVRSEVQYSA